MQTGRERSSWSRLTGAVDAMSRCMRTFRATLSAAPPWALVLLLANAVHASDPKPVWSRAEIERVCLRAIPVSGFIPVPAAGGGWMKCECENLRKKSLVQLDSIRAVRDSLTLDRLKKRKAVQPESPGKIEPLESLTIRDIPFVYTTKDQRMEYRSFMECEEEGRLLRIIENIGQLPGIRPELSRRFRFAVDPTMPSPAIRIYFGDEVNTVWIPKRLLHSPLMSDELLVFLILHELGHDLGDPFVGQQSSDGTIPEFMADRWAIMEGLPAYYSTDLAIAMIPMIAHDFEMYRRSMYTPETVERSTCDPKPLGEYPTQECRLHGITNGVWPEVDPADLIQGYPADCWSPRGACGLSALDITNPNDTLCCEQQQFPLITIIMGEYVLTEEWRALMNTDTIIQRLLELQGSDGAGKTDRKAWLRSRIRRFNARDRSIKHHADKVRSKMEHMINELDRKM